MDELEFRRRAWANPWDDDPDFIDMQRLPENHKVVAELQRFDQTLQTALNIPVPENLAERILLQNTVQHKKWQHRKWLQTGLAASLFLLLSSGIIWQMFSVNPLKQAALAHLYEDFPVVNSHTEISQSALQQALQHYGASLNDNIGTIRHMNHCSINKRMGLHLVIEVSGQNITVLVLPGQHIAGREDIQDQRFSGTIFPSQQASIAVIAEKQTQGLQSLENRLQESLSWHT